MLYAVDQTVAAELGVQIATPFDTDKELGNEAFLITETNDFYDIDNPTNSSTGLGEFATNATDWNLLRDVIQFFESGVRAVVIMIKLMTGTLVFDILSLVDIPTVWIYTIQAPVGILNIVTIIDYIRSRI